MPRKSVLQLLLTTITISTLSILTVNANAKPRYFQDESTSTNTPTTIETETPLPTATEPPPTETPTPTFTPLPSATPTWTPTNTRTRTPTRTFTPSRTRTPTPTPRPPYFAKVFNGTDVGVGRTFHLQYTLISFLTWSAFTDQLPVGMVISGELTSYSGCGGSLTAQPGSRNISLNNFQANSSWGCSVVIYVKATPGGVYVLPPNVVKQNGSVVATSNSATVRVYDPPTFTIAISASPVLVGEQVDVIYTVNNPNSFGSMLTSFSTRVLPGFALVSSTPSSISCSYSSMTQYATGVSLTGLSVPAGQSCTVVHPQRAFTPGTWQHDYASVLSHINETSYPANRPTVTVLSPTATPTATATAIETPTPIPTDTPQPTATEPPTLLPTATEAPPTATETTLPPTEVPTETSTATPT
jgi:hypothetical protein